MAIQRQGAEEPSNTFVLPTPPKKRSLNTNNTKKGAKKAKKARIQGKKKSLKKKPKKKPKK